MLDRPSPRPMQRRTEEELEAARLMLMPFARAGLTLFPVRADKKVPRDKGWQANPYTMRDIGEWLSQGGNVGVLLRDVDLVLDADPRNYMVGDDPIKRLSAAVGANLGAAPTTLSGRGDGGRHLFFRKPADLRIVGSLPDYPGLDFKTLGGFVMAPGSRHPVTGRVYEVEDVAAPITAVAEAPSMLLAMLAKPDIVPSENVAGRISNENLALLLSALDPTRFRTYDRWIALAAAAHDATNGGGIVEWLEWCAGDPAYADQLAWEANIRRWESFTAGRAGGATYRTLYKAVIDAGRRDLVIAVERDFDAKSFADVEADRQSLLTAIEAADRSDFDDEDFRPDESGFDDRDF